MGGVWFFEVRSVKKRKREWPAAMQKAHINVTTDNFVLLKKKQKKNFCLRFLTRFLKIYSVIARIKVTSRSHCICWRSKSIQSHYTLPRRNINQTRTKQKIKKLSDLFPFTHAQNYIFKLIKDSLIILNVLFYQRCPAENSMLIYCHKKLISNKFLSI